MKLYRGKVVYVANDLSAPARRELGCFPEKRGDQLYITEIARSLYGKALTGKRLKDACVKANARLYHMRKKGQVSNVRYGLWQILDSALLDKLK